MDSFKLIISLLLLVPTNWALSIASSPGSISVSSLSPSSSTGSGSTQDSAAATLGGLYRKSRQSRCVRCYDDRYGDDYDRTRYSTRGSSYTSRTYDDRPSNWYYPSERYDRYDDRVRYGADRDYDRYYSNPYNGYYRDRNDDRYSTRNYDRYDRDRYDGRYSYDRSPSETRGYGYDNRDRYYSNDRSNDYYRGGDRYADRNRGSTYDRYGSDDRYYTRYDYRNYRPWDETYRGQSGFDNSGRGYYFANERPNDYYEPSNRPQSRPSGPSTPGPSYLPRDPHDQSRPSNSHGYPDSRPGSSSSPSSSSSSSSPSSSQSSSSSGSDYGNRPRDDVHGPGGGGGGGGGGNSGGDNKNGYTGGSWSYVNDREKDASYKGDIRDKDNQSSAYGSGGRGRPLGGSYLLDRDTNVPEESLMNNQDKPGDSQMKDSPTASKLSSPSSSSTTDDRNMAETKDSN